MCKQHVRACFMKFLGANMVIFSPVTIALGAADVYLAYSQKCTPLGGCTNLTTAVILTWVGIGLWAPLPIFINGIGSIYMANKPATNGGVLCLLSFLNTLVFAPALSVVSGFQVYNKFFVESTTGLPKVSDTYNVAVFGVECSIGGVGAVLWLHTLSILYLSCCCGCASPDADDPPSNDSAGGKVSAANPNIGRQDPAKDPTKDETDRLKLWSAFRFLNNALRNNDKAPAAVAAPAAPAAIRSNYYAVGAAPTRWSPRGYSTGMYL